MRVSEFVCIFILISVCAVNNVGAKHTYQLYIKPQEYDSGSNCPSPCLLLSDVMNEPDKYLKSNTQIFFLAGRHNLRRTIKIFQAENISLVGQHHDTVTPTISCLTKASILIKNSTNINLLNIQFTGCGVFYLLDYASIFPYIAGALVFFNCAEIQVINTKFENSIGHSIIIVNVKGTTTISKTSFFHTALQIGYRVLYSGVLVDFSPSCHSYNETKALVLQKVHFYNFNGRNFESPPRESNKIGTALTIINLPPSSNGCLGNINVSIVNSSFTNCIYYTRPLIKLELQQHANVRFLFKNVTVSRNKVIVYFQLHQIISLIQITSYETEPAYGGHQITLKYSLISDNTITGDILSYTVSGHSSTSMMKNYFYIDSCAFTHNRAVNGLVVAQYVTAFLSLKNSKFKFNRVCDIHMEPEIIHEDLLHVVTDVHIYNSATCSILTSYNSITSFTGYNEFSFNELNSNYFWMIDDYIILEENTTVNVSSNEVGNAMIEITNGGHRVDNMFPPCPIQYVSSKGNLDQQFKDEIFLNYSFVFKDNVKISKDQGTPNVLLTRTFKDCHWLPGTAFKTSHPATVAKQFVHFDNANDNVVGYPYNGCLCYKTSNITNCLTDIVGSVYPGETVEIGFKFPGIEDINSEHKLFQGILKFWNTNSSCQMKLVSPLKPQAATKQCIYFSYTVTLPPLHQNTSTECTFVHHYGTLLYNMYFVKILPCPPGFKLIHGTCSYHPKLEHVLQLTSCNIDNLTVLRPGNTWMMYSNVTRDILYVKDCPFHYCLSSSLYIQLSYPDKQCNQNRKGILCGQCSEGHSAVFGSYRCRQCSNTWLVSIAMFMMVGLLLVLCLFNIPVDLKSTNTTGLLLYASILSTTSSNLFDINKLSKSFALLPVSLLNFDLGFELCFYNGMTEYAKLWLQFAFPVYIICLTCLLTYSAAYIPFIQRLIKNNANFTPAILVLTYFFQ